MRSDEVSCRGRSAWKKPCRAEGLCPGCTQNHAGETGQESGAERASWGPWGYSKPWVSLAMLPASLCLPRHPPFSLCLRNVSCAHSTVTWESQCVWRERWGWLVLVTWRCVTGGVPGTHKHCLRALHPPTCRVVTDSSWRAGIDCHPASP